MPVHARISRPLTTIALYVATAFLGPTVLAQDPPLAPAAKHPPLHDFFGFAPMEIYKLDWGIGQLQAADLNGDSLTDLAIVNNRKSKIEILYQRKPDEPVPESDETADDVNELPDATRFRRDSVSSVWAIASMQVDDLTGDGLPDLVFFGEPKELVIIPNRGGGQWEAPRTIRNAEGVARGSALDTGDVNGDGRADVILLGEKHFFIYLQEKTGDLARPIRYSHSGSSGFMIDDLNGDGRRDLVSFGGEEGYPIAIRLQDTTGRLGPEQRLRLPMIRSLTAAHALNRKAADLFCVQHVSNRVIQYSLSSAEPVRGQRDWLGLTYAYPVPGEAKSRPLVVADVDGDGLSDIVAADPKSAQLIWFQQSEQLGLSHGETFPGLLQVTNIAAADLTGDGKAEVFMLSRDEKSIGMSKLDQGRLTFPQAVPIEGEPVAFDIGPALSDGATYVAYVTKEKKEKTTSDGSKEEETGFALKIQKIDPAGQKQPPHRFELPKLKDTPSAVKLADVNQDGRMDALIFTPYEALTTILQSGDGQFVAMSSEEGSGAGLVKEAGAAGFCLADVTGDGKAELLVAQKSFARALKVANNQWTVVDQYNASGSDVNITGVTALFESGDTHPKVVLYNKDKNELHVLERREDGSYAERSSQPVGAFDLTLMTSAPLAGDRWPSVLLADGNRFSVYCPNRPPYRLAEASQFETKLKDSRFSDVIAGDLNHDSRTDIVASDVSGNYVHILTFDANNQLTFATKFRVFETKSYQRDRTAPEPREMVIADVTNDGHNDLLVVAHDRILLYPAE